ncbi:MAG: WD repeat-containing protein 37, variant 2 [Marteilia pararefringens]
MRKSTVQNETGKLLPNSKNFKLLCSYLPHMDISSSIDFLIQDEKLFVLSASHDSNVNIFDVDNNKTVFQYSGHSGAVNCVKCSGEENLIVSASGDGACHIWQFAELTFFDQNSLNEQSENQGNRNRIKGNDDDDDDDNDDDDAAANKNSSSENHHKSKTAEEVLLKKNHKSSNNDAIADGEIKSLRTPLWSTQSLQMTPIITCEFLGKPCPTNTHSSSSNATNSRYNSHSEPHNVITGDICGNIRVYDFYESKGGNNPTPVWKVKWNRSPAPVLKIFTCPLSSTNKCNMNDFFALYRSKIFGWDRRQKLLTFELPQLAHKGILDAEFRSEYEIAVCHGDKSLRIHDTRNLPHCVTVKKFDKVPRKLKYIESDKSSNPLDYLNNSISVLHVDKVLILDSKYKRRAQFDNNEKFITDMNTICHRKKNILAIASINHSIKIYEIPRL